MSGYWDREQRGLLIAVVVAIVLAVAFVGVLSVVGILAFRPEPPAGAAMPLIPEDAQSDGRYPVGTLPCGTAYLETLHDGSETDYVVWFLDDKVLAVMFSNRPSGHYTYFIDKDFDGRVDVTGTGLSGDGAPASEFYKMVDKCGDGWFR